MLGLWQEVCVAIGIVGAFYLVIMAVFAVVRASHGDREGASDLMAEAKASRLGSIGMTFFGVAIMLGLLFTAGLPSVLVVAAFYGLWRVMTRPTGA
jgi:hypothetical protein